MSAPPRVNAFHPTTQQDWFPEFRRLRDEQPVRHARGTNMYVLTRYDDVLYVLRHQQLHLEFDA